MDTTSLVSQRRVSRNRQPSDQGSADINAKNGRGWTPLHVAAFWNRIEIAMLLLENGANPAAEDSNGKTPEDVAIETGNYEMVASMRRKL